MLIFDQLKKSDRELRVMAIGILIGMGILLAGLWYVQVISSKHYLRDLKKQSFRAIRLPAIRGKILDRNGEPLAENRPGFTVNLYLEELRDLFQAEFSHTRPKRKLSRAERNDLGRQTRYTVVSNIVQQVSNRLQLPLILDEEQFNLHFTNRLALPLPVLENLTSDQTARFLELGANPPGVDLDVQPVRSYPNLIVAGHLLGYVKRGDKFYDEDEVTDFHYRLPDYEGRIGIEAVFDTELRGRAGAKSVLVNSLGYRQSENILAQAEPGKNVVLTIDLPIQQAAERALHSAGVNTRGAAVVLDPRTGDILALASSPSIDPNELISRVRPERWEQLSDPKLRPQLNRATQGTYPPGSIFKVIVALACLEAGTLDPAEVVHSPGYYQLGRRSIHDTADGGRPSNFNFESGFVKSSNYYFIHQGLAAGLERILDMGHRFHLGEPAKVETFQNARGFYPTKEWIQKQKAFGNPWTDGDTANLCIGQGDITVTPLQMAIMTAAIANGGKVLWPRLAQRVEPAEPGGDENAIIHFPPRVRGEIGVDPRHLEIVREAMLKDVEVGGTGRGAFLQGLTVCGKTGTAELKPEHGLKDKITWFVSFAPYEKPTHVVVVMVESGGSGGLTCAPLARMIYQTIQKREQETARPGRQVLATAPY